MQQGDIELLEYKRLSSGDEKSSKNFFAYSIKSSDHSNEDRYVFGEFSDLDFLKDIPKRHIIEILKDALEQLSQHIDSQLGNCAKKMGGSTLSGVLQVPNEQGDVDFYSYNIGDSFCYLVNKKTNEVIRLTRDHSDKNADEMKRLTKLATRLGRSVYKFDFDKGFRLLDTDNMLRINMTRSLGDWATRPASYPNPDIKTHTVTYDDVNQCAILSASDGLNDLLDEKNEAKIISNHFAQNDFSQASVETLCKNARDRVLKPEPGVDWIYHDDITVVVGETSKNHVQNQANFDGHGGDEVSQLAKETLHEFIRKAALKKR